MVVYLTYTEINNLLKSPLEMRTRALVAFQYAAGCRIGELLQYTHKDGRVSPGLLKSNIKITPNEITWAMPNFKSKKPSKRIKYPFVLREELLLFKIIYIWLKRCGEQVFEIKQSRARTLIREALNRFFRPKHYSSHALRRSRATHLSEDFGFTIYDLMDSLGHTKMESGLHYVSTASKKDKMRIKLGEVSHVDS